MPAQKVVCSSYLARRCRESRAARPQAAASAPGRTKRACCLAAAAWNRSPGATCCRQKGVHLPRRCRESKAARPAGRRRGAQGTKSACCLVAAAGNRSTGATSAAKRGCSQHDASEFCQWGSRETTNSTLSRRFRLPRPTSPVPRAALGPQNLVLSNESRVPSRGTACAAPVQSPTAVRPEPTQTRPKDVLGAAQLSLHRPPAPT